jgi:hypothetical protein
MYNSNRVEVKTLGGEIPNDTSEYQIKDGPEFKYRKLVNLVKICINISVASSGVTRNLKVG